METGCPSASHAFSETLLEIVSSMSVEPNVLMLSLVCFMIGRFSSLASLKSMNGSSAPYLGR